MELRQLEYFVAVAEEEHFTRAAYRVSVAQPAVSQQIQRLESELGDKLFVRDSRSVRLSAAGEAFLPHARAALSAVEQGREAVRALRGLLTGRLAIGFVSPLPDRRFQRLVSAYRRAFPGIELTLIEDETPALLDRLQGGEIDAALIGLGPYHEPPPKTEAILVAREPVVVAISSEHRLASKRSIPLSSLRTEPVVSLTHNSLLRVTLEQACRAAGFAPNVVAETSDLDFLVQLAAEQVGVAILPASGVLHAEGLAVIPLTRPSLERRLVFVWPEDYLSPAALAFTDIIRREYKSSAS